MRSEWWANLWLWLILFPHARVKLGDRRVHRPHKQPLLLFFVFATTFSEVCSLSSKTQRCHILQGISVHSVMWGEAVQDTSHSCPPKISCKSVGHPAQNTLWFSLQSCRHFFSGNSVHPRCWEGMLSNLSISFRGWCSQSANGVLSFQKHKSPGQEGKAPFAEGYELALANSFFPQSSYNSVILGWSGAR